jgi:hypothetical protein
MDPWLEGEGFFRDLHLSLIYLLREALNASLPRGYVAKGAELVWVDDEQRREPDVSTFGPDNPPGGNGGVATLPGLFAAGIDLTADPTEQPYLEILSPNGKRLVTAVEILSRSNKRPGGNGRTTYREKQDEFRLAGVNLVEIDLLRAGQHTTAVPPDRLLRIAGPFDYHVSVRVAGSPARFHAAPIKLADRLPAIGIPLDPGVPPVTVDLQPLLDRAYDTGRCADEIKYDLPPDPPLTPEQRAWADAVLREKGVVK